MAIGVARQGHEQQVYFLRKMVNYNDAGAANGLLVGTVPAGAIITGVHVLVSVAFNGGTNTMTVGTTGTGVDVATNAETVPGTLGQKAPVAYRTAITAPFAQDQDIFVSYAQTGAAATAGQAYVIVQYIPNTDR